MPCETWWIGTEIEETAERRPESCVDATFFFLSVAEGGGCEHEVADGYRVR